MDCDNCQNKNEVIFYDVDTREEKHTCLARQLLMNKNEDCPLYKEAK